MSRIDQQLISQARLLATVDKGRPQQANLRRAVSSAYYALFHFAVDRATEHFVGVGSQNDQLRKLLARAFAHTEMSDAAKGFASGNPPKLLFEALKPEGVPKPLQRFATIFVELQERRHAADYDRAETFSRATVLTDVERAQKAIADWTAIGNTHAARVFLLSLLIGKRISSRR